jgi:hypothetical protein
MSGTQQLIKMAESSEYGPAMTQGPLVVIVRVSPEELVSRRKTGGQRYPGGGNTNFLNVKEMGLVIGRKSQTGGKEWVCGFETLNGLPFGSVDSIDALEDQFWFIGVSRSHHNPIPNPRTGKNPDRQGFSVMTFGICSVVGQWRKNIYPGDVLMWYFPTPQEARLKASAKSTPEYQAGRLSINLKPFDWTYLAYAMQTVCSIFLKNDIGISHKLNWSSTKNISPQLAAAARVRKSVLTTVVNGVEVLAMRGLIEVNTPQKKKKRLAELKFMKSIFDGLGADGKTPKTENEENPLVIAYNQYVKELKAADNEKLYTSPLEKELKNPYAFFKTGMDLKDRIEAGEEPKTKASDIKERLMSHKLRKINEVLFLAKIFGLVNNGKLEEQKVTQDVLNSALRCFGDDVNAQMYSTIGSLRGEAKVVLSEAKISQLEKYTQETRENFVQAHVEVHQMAYELSKRAVGMALSYAEAGQLEKTLDLLVRGI